MKKLMFVLLLTCAAAFSAVVNPANVKTAEDVAALPAKSKPLGEMVLHLRQNAASYKTYAEFKNAVNSFILSDGRKFVDVHTTDQWLLNVTAFTQPGLLKFVANAFAEVSSEGSGLLYKMNCLVFCQDAKFTNEFMVANILTYAKTYEKFNGYTVKVFNRYFKAVNELPENEAKTQLKELKRIIYPRIEDAQWKPIIVKVEIALNALE